MAPPIRVGDLVYAVRTCCDAVYAEMGGRIAVVAWIANKSTYCDACGTQNRGLHAGSAPGKAGAPTNWLKRIDPHSKPNEMRENLELSV
jgi:hypothetical protein